MCVILADGTQVTKSLIGLMTSDHGMDNRNIGISAKTYMSFFYISYFAVSLNLLCTIVKDKYLKTCFSKILFHTKCDVIKHNESEVSNDMLLDSDYL